MYLMVPSSVKRMERYTFMNCSFLYGIQSILTRFSLGHFISQA